MGIESRSADEIVVRVRAPGKPVAPSAVLYPGENEWDCDCGSRVSPCEHVAAGIIALTQTGNDDAPVAVAAVEQKWARVWYRWSRAEGGLKVARAIVASATGAGEATERPLDRSLASLLANPTEAARMQVEEVDLRADLLLETGARGCCPPRSSTPSCRCWSAAPG